MTPDPLNAAQGGDARLSRIETWAAQSAMAKWLGFSVTLDAGARLYRLQFAEQHLGNVMIRALHGGVISGFLQAAAQAEGLAHTQPGTTPKIISVHCDFLRSAHDRDLFARVTTSQQGRRVMFVEATGWQDDPARPIARAAIALRLLGDETS